METETSKENVLIKIFWNHWSQGLLLPNVSYDIWPKFKWKTPANLKETCNSYFCATTKNNRLMFFSWRKKVVVCFHKLGEENFKSSSSCNIFNFHNGFVWDPSKVQTSLFGRIARFLWLHKASKEFNYTHYSRFEWVTYITAPVILICEK